jgi:uncharacterized protein (TIGR02646 family)
MKNVLKSPEPQELNNYKKRYSTQFKRWSDLKKNKITSSAIRSTLISDQKGICAYCEMTINEKLCSVEHFIPCEKSTREVNHDLDWQNMLAICLSPGAITDDDSELPHDSPCCGKAKDNFVPDERLLNPLKLTTSRIFSFRSEDGEILPDETVCKEIGISIEYAQFTIDKLRLNVQRLKDRRLVVIDEINKELDVRNDDLVDPILLEQQIASKYFDNGKENYPRFFTTIRWVLGEGAEKHLSDISYLG